MKHVTAADAQQNLSRLLDEAAHGEVVVIHHHGRRIVLRSEAEVPDYSEILHVQDPDRADQWGWEGSTDGLTPREDAGDDA